MVIISCIGDTITKEQAAEMLVPIDERIYLYNNPKNDDNNNS
jgi:prefoldin subunit 5